MREVVTFELAGQQLVGTLHRPSQPHAAAASSKFALLWLNSGYLPRSPVGDVISHLADRFADENGICSFRVDMPGLGDSQGSLADDTQTYFSLVTRGLNVSESNAVAREICTRFGFDGVVMGGICGGAITAIFAADAADKGPISGLLLLDPSFKLIQPYRPPAAAGAVQPERTLLRRLRERVQKLRIEVLQRSWGQALRRVWRYCKPVLAPFRRAVHSLRGRSYLPADANHALFAAFRRAAQRRVPMIVVMAGDEKQNAERFDYVGPVMSESRGVITRHFVAGTNHAFVDGTGPTQLQACVSAWLQSSCSTVLR